MVLADWIALLTGILKFPEACLRLVKMLQKTPEEQHQDLLKRIDDEFDRFEKTGRPTW